MTGGRASCEVNKELQLSGICECRDIMRSQHCFMTERPVVLMSRRQVEGSWSGGYGRHQFKYQGFDCDAQKTADGHERSSMG